MIGGFDGLDLVAFGGKESESEVRDIWYFKVRYPTPATFFVRETTLSKRKE